MLEMIPLNKLVFSDRNVRRTNADEDIKGLADSLHSKGLLQNLIVSPSATDSGKFEVDAGGRRLRALRLNAELKRIAKNHPVACRIIPLEAATESSLAENVQKVAMNPADEVEAFAAIVASYADSGITDIEEQIANCARRFGKTVRFVEQRLRLAALAPEILDALRDGRLSVEAARSYASHPDQKLQLQVFAQEEKKGDWGHAPKSVKDLLAGKIYPLDHRAVVYLGLDAYRAAGGRIASDLFFDGDEREVLLDPGLIDKLAREKAEREAQQLAQADGWCDAVVHPFNKQSWAEAAAPKNYTRKWSFPEDASLEERENGILSYRIAEDGSGLERAKIWFLKLSPEQLADKENIGAGYTQYTPMTDEEWAEQRRQEAIRLKAARLAVPAFAGTPHAGQAFWPVRRYNISEIEIIENEDGEPEFALVAVQIKVPIDQINANLAEAERRYEFEQQELREEAEALAAERAAAEAAAGPDDEEADEHGTSDDEADEIAEAA